MSKRKQQGQYPKLAAKIFSHMHQMAAGEVHSSILLGGEAGIGKTSFIKLLSSLLGIKSIVIEAPHITEEHLINIPFVVFNPQTQATEHHTAKAPLDEYKIVLAQSNLYSLMVKSQPIPDSQYLEYIKTKAPKHVIELYKFFGGTEDKIPPKIQNARNQFKTILFLDEFFRMESPRIRNILRDLLNGRLGIHEIPNSVYLIYASNMKGGQEEGLDDIQSNMTFEQVDFKAPTKNEWFGWFKSEHHNADINMAVIDKFEDLLVDEDISFDDIVSSVRTSPRRWEQLLLYLGASVPVENADEATTVLTYVKNNFLNFKASGDNPKERHSSLSKKVLAAAKDLIKQSNDIKAEPDDSGMAWRSQVDHAVKMQMKLGEKRKYIPVISGEPGIGKTSEMYKVAEKHNLLLIAIDTSNLNKEDVLGIPLPKGANREHITVQFSLPALFQRVEHQIKAQKASFVEKMQKKHPTDAAKYIKEFENQKWKYLIFFDEINRTDSIQVFNALRRVILEKSFGPSGGDDEAEEIKLPEGSVVVAAMNPEGGGTINMTSHFKDVIDVIPGSPVWTNTKSHLLAKASKYKDNIRLFTMQVLESFIEKFKSTDTKYTKETAPFHLDLGVEVYIQPREYTDMFMRMVRNISSGLDDVMEDPTIDDGDIEDEIADIVADSIEDSLTFIFTKHQIDNPAEFLNTMRKWVKKLKFEEISRKVADAGTTVGKSLVQYFEGHNLTEMPKDLNFINVNNTNNNAQVIDQMRELIIDKLKNEAAVKKYIIDDSEKEVQLNNRQLTLSGPPTSKLANFILAYLYSLKIHDFSNDRVGIVGRVLTSSMGDALKKLVKDDKLTGPTRAVAGKKNLQLRSKLMELIEGAD